MDKVQEASTALDACLLQMNPGVKLACVLLIGLASIVFPGSILGIALIAMLLGVSIATKTTTRFVRLMLGFGIPVTVMLLFIQGLYSPANKTILFDFGFAQLGLEGVLSAVKTVTTLLVFLGGFFHFNRTATPSELVADLTERGLTPKAGYLVLASLNVVPQMNHRMAIIQEAQMARGLDIGGGIVSRLKATVPLLGPVVMSSLTDAEERSMTLETHGFHLKDVKHTSYLEVKHSRFDTPLFMFTVVLVVFAIVSRVVPVVASGL